MDAQLEVSGETGNHPDFEASVEIYEDRPFWHDDPASPTSARYQQDHDVETSMVVGTDPSGAIAELLARKR